MTPTDRRAATLTVPARYPATYQVPGTTSPRERRPGCPRRPPTGTQRGGHPQHVEAPDPLDERYTGAPQSELAARIGAAKAALGDRVFILGHHYQRDEVIRWADARGDSYRLSVLAQEQHRGRVHRVLRRALHGRVRRRAHRRPPAGDPPRPQRRLLDGRHGRPRRGGGGLGGPGRGHRHRAGHPDHLHELLGRPEGVRRPQRRRRVHLHQRPGHPRLGARARATGPGRSPSAPPAAATRCCSSPTSTSAATPACRWATALDDMRVWNPRHERGGLTEADMQGRHAPALAGLVLGAPAVHAPSTSRRSAPSTPAGSWSPTPSAATTPASSPTTSAPPTSSSAPSTRRPSGSVIGVGHRDPPRQPAQRRDSRQDRRVPRPAGVPVLDDVPDRRRPPVLGAREPRRGQRRQPDHGRPRHHRVGQGRAPADARDHCVTAGVEPAMQQGLAGTGRVQLFGAPGPPPRACPRTRACRRRCRPPGRGR